MPALRAAPALFVSIALVAACGGAPQPVAQSRSAPARPAPQPTPHRARWARLNEVSAWPAANDKPFVSRGHGSGQLEIVVKLDPAVRARYVELGANADLPAGTVVAAFHRDVRTSRPGPIYVMQKTPEGWRYSAFDADGLAIEHGPTNLCERCHLESPAGGLFGLPRTLPH